MLGVGFFFLLLILCIIAMSLNRPTTRTIEGFLWFFGLSGVFFCVAVIAYSVREACWAWWSVVAGCVISLGASTFFMWLFITSLLGV